MTDKATEAFRTISEVSAQLDVPSHVLRFWETKFTTLRPLKRSGGRRYYRPDDVAVLIRIRDLLYKDGFTIKGAQRFLKTKPTAVEQNAEQQPNAAAAGTADASHGAQADVDAALLLLRSARRRLDDVKSQITAALV
jgi:DNA-binding transcriptional MerR regulator